MESFAKVLNLSFSASWLVLAVICARLLLKKAPKAFHCALWALVAVRLLCPVSFESALSLVPSREVIPEQYLSYEPLDQDLPAIIQPVTNPNYEAPIRVVTPTTVGQVQLQDLFATLLWWTGMGVMAIFAVYSYLSMRLRVRLAGWVEGRVWECDEVASPFILGVLRPRIYLPAGLDPTTRHHVLAHENAHLKRWDHLWKPLGYLLLTIHWFNPVMWLGYWLLCRDIELACDEHVIQGLDRSGVCRYSEALVQCSVNRRNILACPLAFGEVGVKGRVKNMLSYKKPGFWMMVLAIVTAAMLAGCFLTDPVTETEPEGIRTGSYLAEGLEALDPVYLVLRSDGSAWFNYDLSSDNGHCTYTLTETTLTLDSENKDQQWNFVVENGSLRFLSEHSDEKKYLSDGHGLKALPGNTVFVYTEEELLHSTQQTEPVEILPEPVESFLTVPNNDPEALLEGYDLYSPEAWSANWPIDTDPFPRTLDAEGVRYPLGLYQVWGHQDSVLWVTRVRSAGEDVIITLDFSHDIRFMGEVVLPYSPIDDQAPTIGGPRVTGGAQGDSFEVTVTREEYDSGYVWVKLENLYHVKYVSQNIDVLSCPLIPGTEIYEAHGGVYNLRTPTLYLYPDGTGLYTTGFSLTNYPCTYTRTGDTLTIVTLDKIYDEEIQWVFSIEDGILRFRSGESAPMEYWHTSMKHLENEATFLLRDTIDTLDVAIWNTLYEKEHLPTDFGSITFRVLDAFEAAPGQVTAQVCYTYCTFEFHKDGNSSMHCNGTSYAIITFDLNNGYSVTDYSKAIHFADLYEQFSETAREAYKQLPSDIMDELSEEAWRQGEAWYAAADA